MKLNHVAALQNITRSGKVPEWNLVIELQSKKTFAAR